MKELTLQATVENMPQLMLWLDSVLDDLDCPIKMKVQLDVATDELFSNIANYAYEDCVGEATVRVEKLDPPAIRLTFIDAGKPYDPLGKEDPNTTLSAEDRQIGGLGIYMVKKSMDEVTYQYQDGKNMLTILKKL
jgi:anti-sigma regulatory factor (Ser/Thr protein kinase)